jgi:hypothetical protein
MKARAWAPWALVVLTVAGCEEGEPPSQPPVELFGSLGRVTFTYDCVGPGDAQCDVDADLAPLREESLFPRLGVGSRFELTGVSEEFGPIEIDSASPEVLSVEEDGTLLGRAPGLLSVVALHQGVPLDFADVELVEPAGLKLLQATPEGSFEGVDLDIGNGEVTADIDATFTFKFRAIVVDASGSLLAGDYPCTWTSSDPAVAEITTDPAENVVTVVSGQAGSAVVTVEYGEFTATIGIEVGA